MHTLELLLILVAASVALAYAAQRVRVPLAVALVLGGIGLAFVPGIGTVELEPELALALFLPPLLQASAYRTDWPAFRFNLRPILLLAVGAVFFTAAAVAVVAHLLVPSLPWWAAITLGAIVAPPDAVAAAAVLKQVRLPKRIMTVLEVATSSPVQLSPRSDSRKLWLNGLPLLGGAQGLLKGQVWVNWPGHRTADR